MKPYVEHEYPQRSALWFARRSELITASMAADCLGFGEHTPREYLQILKQREHDGTSAEVTEGMQHGVEMEPMLHILYQIKSGRKARLCNMTEPAPHRAGHGFLGASLDGMVVDANGKDAGIVCEYKAPMFQVYSSLGKKNAHGIPMKYVVQMMVQMYVADFKEAHFFAVCRNRMTYQLVSVTYDREWWESFALPRLEEFHAEWKGYGEPVRWREEAFEDVPKTWPAKRRLLEQHVKVRPLLDHDGYYIEPYGGISWLWEEVMAVVRET